MGDQRRTEIARALRAAVRGEVDFGAAARALHTMDASNYRRVPVGVVAPRDAADVAAALEVCREHGVPVVPRGAGTSIAGQATGTGVVLDFTRHLRGIVSVDPEARRAVVQPGVVLDRLREEVRRHGLTFGPDPSTHSRCTLGGMIGNNACGSHSVAWGTTADNVERLSVVTYGGTELSLGRGGQGAPEGLTDLVGRHLAALRTGFPPGLPRRISGYALDALLPERGTDVARAFCGSEGTLAVLTEATVRLVESPPARALAVLGYADEGAAADAAPGLLPLRPLTVEGMAEDLVRDPAARAALPRGGAWLFAETGGATPAEAAAHAARILRAAGALDGTVVTDPAGRRALWRVREDAAGTATRTAGGTEAWPGWEDCAVPPARLGAYLRDFRALLAEHGLTGAPYGHFGDGCIHVRIDFDLVSDAGVGRFRRFSEDVAGLVVAHGGSLSGEHGDGQARAELLPRMYGDELVALFGRFKDLWDPAGGMNPGMLARPARLDENLRFAVLPRERVDVAFGYPHDGGDFTTAVRRCVGVAKCRVEGPEQGPGVMCPSFRATGEERHSTRGRARLLHEMLAGEVVTDGWRSPEVRDALDLCLSCKGCRSDCPVGVDMATYKAEFLHHHYAGRPRPAAHYAMGRLPYWLRLAAPLARPLNALLGVRPLAALAKRVAGIAPERDLPSLAPETFRAWFARRGAEAGDLLLWPDTFTDHLAPSVGRAAVTVLQAAGLRPALPPGRVCCGLTYVSTGQLDHARRVMRRTLDTMAPVLGSPVVVLEPSCAAALRTDLPELLPDDPRAHRLAASVRTFAQALEEHAPDWRPPRLDRPVAGQIHCHQHAVLGDAAERRLLARAGLTGELSGGCCGLAGNFGFERGHYGVSVACAEDRLLPAVRAAAPDAELLADGFSCRTQLDQLAGRRARHLAEVLAEGLEG
ncbi:FAD-binding oxidoreductase [Streptomyces sp. WAC05374]|uniref:FAD-binding and (Fe-S)-binding domain-containing protein n=1 Tax=Streptomyces sp. WAC05374 TaxID=2487420 RepID=UPI000F88BBEE|nr:FAD-binding and (Fe-S)-binding domain-containing protein [Streptomyces sp. WAC05374]RST17737.1 FAD-binding oxidoreductase [Streptomyces sp. WAC05374]TDF47205.1 FAD-binding oxidoreductase [Streptomyces sp. WAC05374]TDF57463.1 FAD-binding oxidoreductase [Streptomyces sp. WAC05374]TDF61568.1 FAD-binding oxidoreductase [Streptomyces sp. WAC05374]